MGIVNVTPDSFSDGGRYDHIEAAVSHGLSLINAGADILDIGGESTRPFSEPVDSEEEWRRVGEVVRILSHDSDCPISIDTSKASVAENAISNGAEIINDVTGLQGDPAMIKIATETGAGICAMHMQGTPETMQLEPEYENVVEEIYSYLENRRSELVTAGVCPQSICLDPGIGFGKTHSHNIELMQKASRFLDLGCPILIGHSRKGFLGKLVKHTLNRDGSLHERDIATAAAACSLADQGIQILRVHDVATVRLALTTYTSNKQKVS
ncbi:MAG: dihydropteroate synthase [Planctomycetaceae bacterium]|nr:dihydropteroate synthase [Planctomycetaceae bacterium]